MKVLIYDCEIIRCIPADRDGYRRPKLQYCGGWHDHANMGISLIGAWLSWDNSIRLFPQQAFDRFRACASEADLIVGFNSIGFDDKLCQANGINIKTDYDLLQEVWWAAGMPRTYTYGITRAGYKLDNLAIANLGKGKSGSGELAPVLWQQNKQWAVASYLVDDILITKAVWQMRSHLKDPTNKLKILKLREPHEPLETHHEPQHISPPKTMTSADVDEIPF